MNETGKIFAVGDIHGCYTKLRSLMDRLPYDAEQDTLVFLGDYIDRGGQSHEVLDYLCDLRHQVKNLVLLTGNHEHLMLQYHRTGDPDLLPMLRHLGIDATLDSYGVGGPRYLQDMLFLPQEHRHLLHSLLPYWENDDYILVHAGLEPAVLPKDTELSVLCESRNFHLDRYDHGKIVVFGHTPFDLPYVTPTRIGIDTGAVYGNLLTAVELPAAVFYHS